MDPRVARSRAAITAAALDSFLSRGYIAANLDDIADEAGVSKKTIYNVFGDKERLFRETMPAAFATAERFSEETAALLSTTDDPETALRDVAVRLAAVITSEPVINLRRLLVGVAGRFPALVQDYYARAPGRVLGILADAFAEFDRRGVLHVEEPEVAAEQFAFLAVGASLDRALLSTEDSALSPQAVEARAEAGARTFLRAYRPGRDPSGLSRLTQSW